MSLDPTARSQAPMSRLPALGSNSPPRQSGELARHGQRIQQLVEWAGTLPDPATRALLQECLESVLALHGEGLARILALVEEAGPDGKNVLGRLTNDEIVRGLLLLHGLHPVDLETRLREALEKVRPYMKSHGGNVELISLEDGMARLRLQGACKTCASSAVTMELAVRNAIEEACPDLIGFEVEGAAETSAPGQPLHPAGQPSAPACTAENGRVKVSLGAS